MPYQVEMRPPAAKALDRLPRDARRRVLDKAHSLADNPRPHGSMKLQGNLNLYRIRVGDWRIVYAIDDPRQSVTITIIADRKDVYRGL
jgi:mRNA interferase RelE/StbE